MPGLLIENGILLTANPSGDIFPNGYLLIEDDRIIAVGDGHAQDSIRSQANEVIDASGQIVMPGLINSHVHLQQTLVRGLADDRAVWDWVQNVAFPVYGAMAENEVYLATMVGIVENIRSGATTTTDNQTVRSLPGNFDAAFRAAKGQENARLRLDFNPHALYLVTENTLMKVQEKALEWGIGIHLHTAETEQETEMFFQETGLRHVEWLADRDLLGPHFQLAHAVWLNDFEIDAIAESGAVPVHNPVCNMFCGSGVSPVPQMLEAGIPVAVGTDGQACNNGQEMIDTLKWVANVHKLNSRDAMILSPEQVIQMACRYGAFAYGQPDQIGSLEPGKKADVILVDMGSSRLTMPSLSVTSLLVNFARGEDVVTTIVDGKILMRDREILFLDEYELTREFSIARAGLLKRIGLN